MLLPLAAVSSLFSLRLLSQALRSLWTPMKKKKKISPRLTLAPMKGSLLEGAKNNTYIAQERIEKLEEQVKALLNRTDKINQDAERSRMLYREHIKHISSLAVTGKDSGEILKPRQPDLYNGDPKKLQEFLTSLQSYYLYYPI
ncbi:uncharacterized protein FRV6_16460 [Fusarium oxysporum]|uniref:Uncharacterized protein n=1 Tax=Fusarium oxysporum TaxID=5507 RepID=A0A2H3TUP2_FUSOX|nr:uncharacterized protein FRV6_16460 [Fusarium oxysporum]